jgi:hypothetical protein
MGEENERETNFGLKSRCAGKNERLVSAVEKEQNGTNRKVSENSAQVGDMTFEVLAVKPERLDGSLHLDDLLEELAVLLALDLAGGRIFEGGEGDLSGLFALLERFKFLLTFLDLLLKLRLLLRAVLDVVVADRSANAALARLFSLVLAVLSADGLAAVRAVDLAVCLVAPVAALRVANPVVEARTEDAGGDVAFVAAEELAGRALGRLEGGFVVNRRGRRASGGGVEGEDEVPVTDDGRVGVLDGENARSLAR